LINTSEILHNCFKQAGYKLA